MVGLNGFTVAILVENGFEQVELEEPRKALEQAGASTRIVSPQPERVRGWKYTDWGDELPVDVPLERARPQDFDGLLLPGGVMNPDRLRLDPAAVRFVEWMFINNRPIAAICHGPWMLIEADAVRGKQIAAWPSLKTDLRNAGADWVDHEVVMDGNIVTSRKPDDLTAFNRAMVDLFLMAAPQLTGDPGRVKF